MRRRGTISGDGAGAAEAEADSPGSKSPAKLKRSVSFGPSEAAAGDGGDGAAESPQSHVGRRGSIRPPSILTGAESPFPAAESPYESSVMESPMAIQSPVGGTRHPSVPMLSPDSLSPLATTHDRSLARPTTIPQSPGTPLQLRNRSKTVVIDDPKALPGASWFTLFFVACHYFIALFLWMSGYYYNSNPAPTSLFLIPSFTSGCVTALGMLCLVTNRNKYIGILMSPRTGLVLSSGGLAAGTVWCLLVYGPRHNEYSSAIQFAGFSGMVLLYFVLVRRRLRSCKQTPLNFSNLAFAQGGHAVARVRSIMFRALLHALVLGVYISFWNMLYIQLVDLGPLPNATETVSNTPTTNSSAEESSMRNIASVALPKWVKKGAQSFSDEFLRYLGRIYMVYNLYFFSQMVKASMQISVSGVATSVMLASRYGMPVRMRNNKQLNDRLKNQIPSVFLSAHLMLISCSIRALFEAMRRFSKKRKGVPHNIGSLGITAFHPILASVSSHGMCFMELTGNNLMKSSSAAFHLYKRTGMDTVVNDDILFGARVASYLLVASACSIAGSLLVEIFGFPLVTTVQMGHMCFVTALACGNWGMEAAETWVCSLYLEFAEYPESVYISNPELANNIHAVLFNCDKRIGQERARRFDKKRGWFSRSKKPESKKDVQPRSKVSRFFLGSPMPGVDESDSEDGEAEATPAPVNDEAVQIDGDAIAEVEIQPEEPQAPPKTFMEMQLEKKMRRRHQGEEKAKEMDTKQESDDDVKDRFKNRPNLPKLGGRSRGGVVAPPARLQSLHHAPIPPAPAAGLSLGGALRGGSLSPGLSTSLQAASEAPGGNGARSFVLNTEDGADVNPPLQESEGEAENHTSRQESRSPAGVDGQPADGHDPQGQSPRWQAWENSPGHVA